MRLSVLVAVVIVLVGCGGGDSVSAGDGEPGVPGSTTSTPERAVEAAGAGGAKPRVGRTIVLRASPFGKMLFDARRQAIYIFQNDRRDKSVCYGACAEAWPPVLTRGKPRAATGVRASLLGSARRRDGQIQVTYAGKPLYYYAHEKAGEVRCHNVDLNGGLWWVVGADGKRRP